MRKRIGATTMALAGLALLAGTAKGFTPDRAAIFVEALRGNDCAMTIDQAQELLPPLGLQPEEVQQFVDLLFAVQMVGLSQDMSVLSLSDVLCAADIETTHAMIETAYQRAPAGVLEPWVPSFSPAEGAAMIGAVRDNGCGMSEAEAGVILAEIGMTPTLTRDVAAVLLDAELASVDDVAGRFALSEALCAADPAQDEATIEAARVVFVEALDADQQPGDDAPAPTDEGQ